MRLVIVGGSDAGISAALRARELSADTQVSVVLADGYPDFSICGIPYHVSGEVPDWRTLAHRSKAELAATGICLITDASGRRSPALGPRRGGFGPLSDSGLTVRAVAADHVPGGDLFLAAVVVAQDGVHVVGAWLEVDELHAAFRRARAGAAGRPGYFAR